MAFRLFTLLPLLLAAVSAEPLEPMNMSDASSVAEPMAPIASLPTQQQAPAAVAAAPASITHEQANAVIQAAVAKAVEIKMPSNIAVTDPAGHLVSFLRMDGALLVSIEVAQKKAKTVSMFGGKYRTGDLYNATSPGGALYGKFSALFENLLLKIAKICIKASNLQTTAFSSSAVECH
jgi:uncharacterized protein GlcG (DUF336 family)